MENIDLKEFERTFGDMIARASNPRKPLTEIGAMMVSEMQETIRVEGRPEPWEKSERAKREGGQTLRDTGTLMRGIIFEVGERSVASGPTMMGRNHITDPRAMALLAFGGEVQRHARSEIHIRHRKESGQFDKGRSSFRGKGFTIGAHTAHYPVRNYTYIPPESGVTFGQIIQQYVIEGR
ncbi:MAG: phage virion morphogenesis protein [Ignavibacteriales bacterium]|nr:phage virion morphogenesis protein [Ignavibacteriales bacterium]